MTLPYTGNGHYCYANSLHMSLLGAGADRATLPNAGFLECLTTIPFGKMYLRLEDGPLAFFSPPNCDPDQGLSHAIETLGWACEEWHGENEDEALERLRSAVEHGHALLGPLDCGYLSYTPGCKHRPGGDHFVVALALKDDIVRLHDPAGYPCAMISTTDLLIAWRGEHISYGPGPFRMRSAFRQIQHVSQVDMVARTLPRICENLEANPDGPVVYGGVRALHLLATDLRGEVPDSLPGHLIWFALPLAARRCLDAASFLQEANRPEAAIYMEQQADLFGEALALAMRKRWKEVADVVERVAEVEQRLIAAV